MRNSKFGRCSLNQLVIGAACLLASATTGWTAPGGFVAGTASAQAGAVGVQGTTGNGGGGVAAGHGASQGSAGGSIAPGQHIGTVASGGGSVGVGSPIVRQPAFAGGATTGRGVGSFESGRHIDGRLVGVARPPRPEGVAAQPNNAWSEARGVRFAPAARVGRYGYNGAYDGGQFYRHNRLPAGQYLHNGPVANNAWTDAREDRARDGHRRNPSHRYSRGGRYFYGGLYYPYFYGAALPAFYGDTDGGYGASLGVDTESTLNGNLSADTNAGSNGGYWDRREVETQDEAADDRPALPPNTPAQVGPENPAASERHAPAETGPDSLVEAVQSELATRGYFVGKVDAMYGEPTREALRRFQADRKLAVTGRINEATLHALQLD